MEPQRGRVEPGRLPQRIYWFRRGVVLVAVALVIGLIVWLSSLTSSPKTSGTPVKPPLAPASTEPSAAPTDSTEATALPGQGTASLASSVQGTPTASSAPPADCDPGVLTLAVSAPGSLKAGATAQLTVTVTNSGLDPCTFTFDSQFTMTIVSGTDQIWTTADCAQWAPSGSQQLAVGATATWQTTWDRHRSEAGCKLVQTTLRPGTYVVNAMYTGAATAQQVVLLTA
ncbi:MAG TPA: hypothetical protein VLS51_04265 [Propionibacteriaceae bacterium]|nr:hypothetical protein [Propionibacteriaceae bacterium]